MTGPYGGADLEDFASVADWTTGWGQSAFSISGGQLQGTAGFTDGFLTSLSLVSPVETWIEVPTARGAAGEVCMPFIFDNAAFASRSGYECEVHNGGADLWIVRRRVTGTATTIDNTISQAVGNGDAVGMAIVGTQIEIWYKASGGSWTKLKSITDNTTRTTWTHIGVETGDSTAMRFDNWGAAAVSLAPTLPQHSPIIMKLVGTKVQPYLGRAQDDIFIVTGTTLAVPTVTETDSIPVDFGKLKSKALPLSSEVDSVLAFGRSKAKALSIVLENDTIQAFGRFKTKALSAVNESDAAQALDRLKSKAIGIVTETDLALAIVRAGGSITLAVATVLESDSVQSIGRAKSKTLAVISESEVVQSFGRLKSKALSVISETNVSNLIIRNKIKAISLISTAMASIPFGRAKSRSVVSVGDTNIALTYGKNKSKSLGTVLETDLARAIIRFVAPIAHAGARIIRMGRF